MMKTVLISGATSGFGRACAKLFVGKGWQAVITGRRKERPARVNINRIEIMPVCQSFRPMVIVRD